MTRKNVLHITNSNALSQYLISIGKFYNREKYNMFIGCFDKYGPLNKELEKHNIKTFNIPVKSNFDYLFKSLRLYFLIKKNKIEVLHLHTFYPSLFGVIIGKIAGVKKIVVTRHHADQHIKLGKRIHIFIDGWTARNCDCLIAVSEWTKSIMVKHEKVPANKINVVYNGLTPLDEEKEKDRKWLINSLTLPSDSCIFLCISRIMPEKNLEASIEAMYLLKKNNVKGTLLICGDGIGNEYYKHLIRLIESYNIKSNVFFLGFRTDIGNILRNCDALIHTSFDESFGFAVLEAMYFRKNIFASNIPALHEVATENVAYFFDPNNPKELVEKIKFWIKNPAENIERINRGGERYNNIFTFTKMLEKYEELYEK